MFHLANVNFGFCSAYFEQLGTVLLALAFSYGLAFSSSFANCIF